LVIKTPIKVAAIPRKTLPEVYRMKFKNSPSLSKARFSFAKVENVVNPPQKPTARNNFQFEVSNELLSENP
jgi:hypothetical protein